jgi:hypothetical protein
MGASYLADRSFNINTPGFLVPALLTITGALAALVAAIDGLPAAPQPTMAWMARTSQSKPGPINGLV